jgi:hypothetical protein
MITSPPHLPLLVILSAAKNPAFRAMRHGFLSKAMPSLSIKSSIGPAHFL